AYPEEPDLTTGKVKEIVAFGHWQGVAVPRRWDDTAGSRSRSGNFAGLLTSLHNVNHHQLATLVAEEYTNYHPHDLSYSF
ncbi:MAG: hypothetical protein WA958_05400, partial [Tunicatimonas sp.]